MFANYYLSAEVGAAFQCLWDNVDNLWDAFAGYWVQVARKFSTYDNVLGYELINEPWAGDVQKHPELLLPGRTEKQYLEPLYAHLHKAIREVDDEKIIFYEGLTIDYWPSGFSQGPGERRNLVISFSLSLSIYFPRRFSCSTRTQPLPFKKIMV